MVSIVRERSASIFAPVALAGALFVSGCSIVGDTSPEAPVQADASASEVEMHDSATDVLETAPANAPLILEELSTELDRVTGLNGVGIATMLFSALGTTLEVLETGDLTQLEDLGVEFETD